jgi:hypothetical protein
MAGVTFTERVATLDKPGHDLLGASGELRRLDQHIGIWQASRPWSIECRAKVYKAIY